LYPAGTGPLFKNSNEANGENEMEALQGGDPAMEDEGVWRTATHSQVIPGLVNPHKEWEVSKYTLYTYPSFGESHLEANYPSTAYQLEWFLKDAS
jgi:hypothetical protein